MIKKYFEPFAIVKTDFEILKLPKKVDIIIIEEKEPIAEHVKLLKYFKRFNIIEFKSSANRFRILTDLYKIGIYINGFILAEKESNIENTTFTLISTHKPNKLIKQYNAERIRQGLYITENISIIPVYIVAIEELEMELQSELTVLKEFTSKIDLEDYLLEILNRSIKNTKEYEENLSIALSLYSEKINEIINREGIKMTLVERNIRKWNDILGLKDKYLSEGIEEGKEKEKIQIARKALAQGLDLSTISFLTGLTKKQLIQMNN